MNKQIQIAAEIALRTIETVGEKLSPGARSLFLRSLAEKLDHAAWLSAIDYPPPPNTTVLACAPSYDTPVFAAQWDPCGEDGEPDDDGIETGLWWDCRTHSHLEPHTHPVTHWRYLPPGPKTGDQRPEVGDQKAETKLLTAPAGAERPDADPDTNTNTETEKEETTA